MVYKGCESDSMSTSVQLVLENPDKKVLKRL